MIPRFLMLWQEERGSTALTLSWFMLVALFLAVGLDGLLGIFTALQKGRTASVAAILATTRAIATELRSIVEIEAAERVQSLLNDETANGEIDEALEDLNEEQEACAQLVPLCAG
jgi:hypothetical protein